MKDLGWWLALGVKVAEFTETSLELRGEGYSQKMGTEDLGDTRSLAAISITSKRVGTSFGCHLGAICLHSLCCLW